MAKRVNTDQLRRIALTFYVECDDDTENGGEYEEKFIAYTRRITPANRGVLGPVLDIMDEKRQENRALYPLATEYNTIGDDKERSKFVADNYYKLNQELADLNRLNAEMEVEEVLRFTRAIVDTEHKVSPEQADLLESDIDSEFWQNQDVAALSEAVERFRRPLQRE